MKRNITMLLLLIVLSGLTQAKEDYSILVKDAMTKLDDSALGLTILEDNSIIVEEPILIESESIYLTKDDRIQALQNLPKYANLIVLDIYTYKNIEYALVTKEVLQDNTIGSSGLPLSRPMSKRTKVRIKQKRPTAPERRQNPGSITCKEHKDPLALRVENTPLAKDPGDQSQCVYQDVQTGFTAMAKLIVRQYYNGSINKTFKKWQSDTIAFKRKLHACRKRGVNTSMKYDDLSIEDKMIVIDVWRTNEGYREKDAANYIVVADKLT